MKQQLIAIYGGQTFNAYDEYVAFLKSYQPNFEKMRRGGWKDNFEQTLGDRFEIIRPSMPCAYNAKYAEWKIYFEKLVPYFTDEAIFLGGSLGGIFLAKWFSENAYPKKVKALFLVAPPYDNSGTSYSLADFVPLGDVGRLASVTGDVRFYFSEDDPEVPFSNMEKYKKHLPNARFRVFKDRGHFGQYEFPEIVEDLKASVL